MPTTVHGIDAAVLPDLPAALAFLRGAGVTDGQVERASREAAARRRRYWDEHGLVLAEDVEVEVEIEDDRPGTGRPGGRPSRVVSEVVTRAKPGTRYAGAMPEDWLPPRLVLRVLR